MTTASMLRFDQFMLCITESVHVLQNCGLGYTCRPKYIECGLDLNQAMSRYLVEQKQASLVRADQAQLYTVYGLDGAQVQMVWTSDIICSECGAGYRRVNLATVKGTKGEYRCLTCDRVLEVFDGSFGALIRLTAPSQNHSKRRRQGQS